MIRRSDVAWYAVRCCCQPGRIFGFLSLDGRQSTHTILDRYGRPHTVELRALQELASVTFPLPPDMSAVKETHRETAIYSDDRPIEFWRTIPGFLEVRDDGRG